MDEAKLRGDFQNLKSFFETSDGFLSFDTANLEVGFLQFQDLLHLYLNLQGLKLPEGVPNGTSSCGHIFEHGDVIYRCKNCTHDETCVLCSKCFNDADHIGHQISFSASKGSGGSCDCGEDESWCKPLHCPLHQDKSISLSLGAATDSALMNFFQQTIQEILPYIVQPYHTLKLDMLSNDNADRIISLVLFNDEKHSFDDVITILNNSRMLSGHPSAGRTPEHYAKTVDIFVQSVAGINSSYIFRVLLLLDKMLDAAFLSPLQQFVLLGFK